jgi:hypothetical protein
LSAASGCTRTMAAARAPGSIRAAREKEGIMEKDGRISHIAAWLVSVATLLFGLVSGSAAVVFVARLVDAFNANPGVSGLLATAAVFAVPSTAILGVLRFFRGRVSPGWPVVGALVGGGFFVYWWWYFTTHPVIIDLGDGCFAGC